MTMNDGIFTYSVMFCHAFLRERAGRVKSVFPFFQVIPTKSLLKSEVDCEDL